MQFYKIVVFIPKRYAEKVKKAMFEAGGGEFGNYSQCSFESEGLGQFCPLSTARPFLGKKNQITKVKELRLEMICQKRVLKKVLKAMKTAHPYEMPAFDLIKLI